MRRAPTAPTPPVARDVVMRRMSLNQAGYALFLRGLPRAPIQNVGVVECDFATVGRPNVVENVTDLWFRDVRLNGKLVSEGT